MYTRRSFHECANELQQESTEFKFTYLSESIPPHEKQNILMRTSKSGVEILSILALSIRRGMDYGEIENDKSGVVGGIKLNIELSNAEIFKSNYLGPYTNNTDLRVLNLRNALNKIAHFNAARSSFYVDKILIGDLNDKYWVAVINIDKFCQSIRNLPDKNTINY